MSRTTPDQVPTYTTVDRRTISLAGLAEGEAAFFRRCYEAYQAGRTSEDFTRFVNLVSGGENPLVAAAGGRITRSVWNHPLFQAVRDLEDRLGVRVGRLEATPGEDFERDPLEDAWLPSTQAAAIKGVTLKGLHKAIHRGDVVARPARPGGVRLVVSERSLSHWQPNRVRQAARRKATAATP